MSRSTTRVTTLPSTASIKDPEVRTFLDSFVAAWDQRSGFKNAGDPERFITQAEVQGFAISAMAQVFSRSGGSFLGNIGGAAGGVPSAQDVNDAIDDLADFIRKSIIYQILGTDVQPIDIQNLRSKIDAAIRDSGAAILREERARSDADEAFAETLTLLVARLGQAEAGVANEASVRAQKDNALAQAINTVWANIGGNQALIQDGALAAVSPANVSATKWTQVEAAAIDPNTGQPNSSIVRQEFQTYANKANGTFGSIYSVRTQISVAGQTVVGGFGLAATAGAGSAAGPTIDFIVRADKFAIAATSATPSGATQIAQGSSIPFMVLTSNQVVNGVTYPPGVYIKKAVIGDATIGSAQIANAAITSLHVQDAAITNAKIGNAIWSSGFVSGSVGWYIDKQGNAEFNNVTIRNSTLITYGTHPASHVIRGTETYDTGKGLGERQLPVGSFVRGPTFYIDTGFIDPQPIRDQYSQGFFARVSSPNNSWITPSGTGDVYELSFEVSPAPSITWGYVGSVTSAQRIVLIVTPILKILKPFTTVQINNYSWSLFRQR